MNIRGLREPVFFYQERSKQRISSRGYARSQGQSREVRQVEVLLAEGYLQENLHDLIRTLVEESK